MQQRELQQGWNRVQSVGTSLAIGILQGTFCSVNSLDVLENQSALGGEGGLI